MKKIVLAAFFFFSIVCALAQEAINPTVLKFKTYYEAGQSDSIFSLFDAQMKAAINLEKTKIVVDQLKSNLGAIVGMKKKSNLAPQIEDYRLSFEKPLNEFALYIKDNYIAGLRPKPVENDDQKVIKASPDNYSLDNSGIIYGTLNLPKNAGPVPLVLLIAGSGPTDRNMNLGNTLQSNTFLMLSDSLAKYGIASLRYDKRGVGKSMAAAKAEMTLDDYIDDAVRFTEKLKSDNRFSKIIILGHSEGSTIGVAAAIKTMPGAFISLSGPADQMTDILKGQLKAQLNDADFKVASGVLAQMSKGKVTEEKLPESIATLLTPQNQKFLISSDKYQSINEIKKLRVPTLIIGGTTDLQVSQDQAKKLSKANPKAELKVITGMNHVLKQASADRETNMATYYKPELPIHPELSPAIVKFIQQL